MNTPLTAVNIHPDRRRAAMVSANWRCQSPGCHARAGYTTVSDTGTVSVHCGRHATPSFLITASSYDG